MKKITMYIIVVLIVVIAIILSINLYVKLSTKSQIIENNNYGNLKDIDCIVVLGAGIWGDKPSPMLEDRLLQAIELYENNISSKIIMSGDHSSEDYDEVNTMKNFAIEKGVPSENIFMDHAGFSSYESIYRAKEIFEAKRIVIVTQKYHLYRALYIANQLGLEAYGIGADPRQYVGATYRELREILARNKDFVKCIFKPEPTYLGDTISVNGNGDVTNDKDINNSDKNETNVVNSSSNADSNDNNNSSNLMTEEFSKLKAQVEKDEADYGNNYQKFTYCANTYRKEPDRIYFKAGNQEGFYLFEKEDENYKHLLEVSEDRMAYSVMEDYNLYCFTPDSVNTMMKSGDNYIIFDYDNGNLTEYDSDFHKDLIFRFSENTRLYRLATYLSYNKDLISKERLGKKEFAMNTNISGYKYMMYSDYSD